ncbi:MAG: carboxypeptidase regulatory-like domain-containing protein [Candidatus Solibacter sp.]
MRYLAFLLVAMRTLTAAGIEGRVVEDHTGNPLASVEVRIAKAGQRTLAAQLETDSSGQFRAQGLTEGEYQIDATKSNFIGVTLRVAGLPGPLTLRLVRCGVITGQVMDAQGQPMLGVMVYAMPKPVSGPLMPYAAPVPGTYMRVNERGEYRLHSLPPGEYAVAAAYGASTAMFGSSGGADVRPAIGSGVQIYPTLQRPRFFTVAGGEAYRNVDFAIVPTALHNVSGKVVLPDPKTRYWLALTTAEQPGLATAVTGTSADGSFRFEGIADGSYTLTASGPITGYGGKGMLGAPVHFGRMPISVAADISDLTVPVQKGSSVAFLLRAPAGAQGAGGCPSAAQVALTALEDFATRIDRTGAINAVKEQPVADLAPTKYQVGATGLGEGCYLASSTVLDLASGGHDAVVPVLVAPAGSIRGRLTGGADPRAFSIVLVAADAEAATNPLQVVNPDSSGKFGFGGLRPGRYRIAAQSAGAAGARWVTDAAHMLEIQIVAGAPTEMELPAPGKPQ